VSEPTKGPYFLYQDNGYMHIYPEMWLGEPNREVRKGLIAGVSPWDGAFQHNRSEWMAEAVEGRDLYIIDDSIVRLNTLPRLIKLAKSAGAKSVSVLIGSPPVRFPDFYGIDTPSQTELAAANMTVEQMRRKMKAKYLGFLSLEGMVAATGLDQSLFNLSPFNGVYPIDIGKRKKEIKTPISMEYSA
jgi:glutamine phosphoribosylpyrophosphate amidotransferase